MKKDEAKFRKRTSALPPQAWLHQNRMMIQETAQRELSRGEGETLSGEALKRTEQGKNRNFPVVSE